MPRSKKEYDPLYSPIISSEDRQELIKEKIPMAMLGSAIPAAIVFRKFPLREMLPKLGEAAALGTAGTAGGFLALKAFRGTRSQADQRRALSVSPLKTGEKLQMGPGGKRGVWRSIGNRHIFIEVKPKQSVPQAVRAAMFSSEGHDLHIDCAMGSKKRKIPLKPSGRT